MTLRAERLLLAAILAVAAAVRFAGLGATDFWNDESYVAILAAADDPIAVLTSIEHSPPGYFFLVRAWSRVAGTGEAALRAPSAAMGTLGVAAVWLVARAAFGPAAGLAAAAIHALSPFPVVHAREARGYVFLVAPYLLAVWGAGRILEGDRRRGWTALAAGGTVCAFLHYNAVLSLGALVASLILLSPRRPADLRNAALWAAAGLLLYLPWLPHMRQQLLEASFYMEAGAAPPLRSAIVDGLYALPRFLAWSLAYDAPPRIFFGLYGPLAAAGAAVVAASAAGIRREAPPPRRLLGLLLPALAGLLFVGYASGKVRELPYLLPAVALLHAAAGGLLAGLWTAGGARRAAAAVAATVLLLLSVAGIREAYANRFHLEDRLTRAAWREAAAAIEAGCRDGDAVFVPAGWPSSLGWYLRGRPVPLHQLARDTPYFRRAAPFIRLVPTADPSAVLREVAARHPRLWYVEFREGLVDADGSLRELAASLYGDSAVVRAAGPRLTLFSRGDPSGR